jgi:hypothetical protein
MSLAYFIVPLAPCQSAIRKVHHAVVASIMRACRIGVDDNPDNHKRTIGLIDRANVSPISQSAITSGSDKSLRVFWVWENSGRHNSFASTDDLVLVEGIKESVSPFQRTLPNSEQNLPSRLLLDRWSLAVVEIIEMLRQLRRSGFQSDQCSPSDCRESAKLFHIDRRDRTNENSRFDSTEVLGYDYENVVSRALSRPAVLVRPWLYDQCS